MHITGIIMGVGAPNDSKAAGKSMCAILLSRELGFVRIYPIPASESFPVWSMVSCVVEKGNDNRSESFKLISYEITDHISEPETKREILNRCVLKSGSDDPIDYQNTIRRSIFMIRPSWGDVEVSLSQKIPSISPDDEECGWIVTQGRHWIKPYIQWTSDQGKEHKSHLGGREIYEGIRNNPHSPWNLMNNLQISNPDWEHWMLMGNMKDRRNVWLCVHLHRLKKCASGSTPLFSHPIIGDADEWPYTQQEDSNVEIVDGHPTLFTMKNTTSTYCRGNTLMTS